MSFINTVFPVQADNDFRGGKIPLYGFCLLLLPVIFRTFVHFLKDDSGVNSIASIHLFPGDPDPNNVIYMYSSLWGSQQAITLIVYLVVLYRYRNLVPLMFLLMLVEIGFRSVSGALHPLTEEFYVRTPPGMSVSIFMGLPSLVLLAISHWNISNANETSESR